MGSITEAFITTPAVRYSLVGLVSGTAQAPVCIGAKLGLPATGAGALPAVVIVHGSHGLDDRGPFYANLLHAVGVATLEIDMFTARGFRGRGDRPGHVPDVLPDAFAALSWLAHDDRIDPQRIGIMGFSYGGVVSMLCATQAYAQRLAPTGLKFAAHAPLYPVLWAYNRLPGYEFGALTGAPVFIQAGAADAYDGPDSAHRLLASLAPQAQAHVHCEVYEGATHAWDRMTPAESVVDPAAHQGLGGAVDFIPNPTIRTRSGLATRDFFLKALAL